MEEEPDASESDADGSASSLEPSPARSDLTASHEPPTARIWKPAAFGPSLHRPVEPPHLGSASLCGDRVRLRSSVAVRNEEGSRHAAGRCPGTCPPHGPPGLRQRHGRGRSVRLSRAGHPARDGGIRGRADDPAGRRSLRRAGLPAPSGRTSCSRVLWPRDQYDAVVNGYEWTEQRDARLPRHPAVLRLPVAVDGPPRAAGCGPGPTSSSRSQAAAMVDRRAGGLGRGYLCRRGGRSEHPRDPVRRGNRRHDGRAERPV